MVKEAVTVRFLVILVLVGAVHACIGGALWRLSGSGDSGGDGPPAEEQPFEVAPPVDTGSGNNGETTAPPPPVTPGYVSHKVQPGESYWGIASRYKTTVGELQRINGHGPNHVLQPGQTLKVPGR